LGRDPHGPCGEVADGDTITLLDSNRQQHRIRLAGIDAPERAQPFGQRSKQHLSELAFGKDAKVECYKVDRNDRDVCIVYVDGKNIGLEQLDAGLAGRSCQQVHPPYLVRLLTEKSISCDRSYSRYSCIWRS
jgi:endonuclease YncB( thermonuclease family)